MLTFPNIVKEFFIKTRCKCGWLKKIPDSSPHLMDIEKTAPGTIHWKEILLRVKNIFDFYTIFLYFFFIPRCNVSTTYFERVLHIIIYYSYDRILMMKLVQTLLSLNCATWKNWNIYNFVWSKHSHWNIFIWFDSFDHESPQMSS